MFLDQVQEHDQVQELDRAHPVLAGAQARELDLVRSTLKDMGKPHLDEFLQAWSE